MSKVKFSVFNNVLINLFSNCRYKGVEVIKEGEVEKILWESDFQLFMNFNINIDRLNSLYLKYIMFLQNHNRDDFERSMEVEFTRYLGVLDKNS